jgi:hypothetical protein
MVLVPKAEGVKPKQIPVKVKEVAGTRKVQITTNPERTGREKKGGSQCCGIADSSGMRTRPASTLPDELSSNTMQAQTIPSASKDGTI